MATATPWVAAADTPEPQDQEIVITASAPVGSVNIPIPADVVLDAQAIQSYGVSSLADLLTALSAQTRSARGRGEGRPVVLLNGKRISGFAELRDLPSEAIARVEILPEEAALRFGYTADQRVINFILRPGFKAVTAEAELGGPTAGGRTDREYEAGFVRIGTQGRLNLNADYTAYGSILERERGIIASDPQLVDYRTLAPSLESLKLNAVANQTLRKSVGATLNVQYEENNSQSLLGLRKYTTDIDPLTRDVRTRNVSGGLSLDGRINRFNWTASASGQRTTTTTLTDQDSSTPLARDRARARLSVVTAVASATGPLLSLPAGPANMNLTAGVEMRDIVSHAKRLDEDSAASVGRDDLYGRINLDIPLTSRRRAFAAGLGDFSLNLNGGYRHLSDFGALTSYGYGLNWSPVRGLSFLASFVAEEAAPTPAQLGDPLISTPNALLFDYVRGETALVTLISGGNRALGTEERRDYKLGLTYEPQWIDGLTFTANYFRNRSTDPIATFPALTPVIAAAFPERITRNSQGQLIAVDQRALNFLAARSTQLRWGLSFQKQFGQSRAPARTDAGSPRGPHMGGFGPWGGQGGRWSLALYHTLKLADEIEVAAGVPKLDLRQGDTITQSGGTARHMVEMEGGWFYRGIGFRVNGAYQSGTSVNIGGAARALDFSDLATINLRAFINMDQKPALTKVMPILKGVRIALRVDNLLNDIQKVRDSNGLVPLRYQPGYVDPVGRRMEISIRKIF